MRLRTGLVVTFAVLFTVVIQTTLIAQLSVFTPELVTLVVILFALTRIKPEVVLGIAFATGVVVDLVGSSLVGLRAMVFTLVAFAALRTRERAEIGRVFTAVWAAALSLLGFVLLIFLGTVFGQASLMGSDVLSRMLTIPIANMILAALIGPLFVRLVDRDSTALRFT